MRERYSCEMVYTGERSASRWTDRNGTIDLKTGETWGKKATRHFREMVQDQNMSDKRWSR